MVYARYFVIPRGDFRFSRVGGSFRTLFDAGEGCRETDVYTWCVLRLTGGFRGIDAEAIRFVGMAGAERVMFVDLAPCNF